MQSSDFMKNHNNCASISLYARHRTQFCGFIPLNGREKEFAMRKDVLLNSHCS